MGESPPKNVLLESISPILGPRQVGRQRPHSSRVRSAAGISLHPLAFWPDHRGENSPLPWLSALARRGAMAEVAKGKVGTAADMGPSSLMMRLTMPRAGRPEKRFVSAVWRAASLFRAARWTALVVHSGQSR